MKRLALAVQARFYGGHPMLRRAIFIIGVIVAIYLGLFAGLGYGLVVLGLAVLCLTLTEPGVLRRLLDRWR